MRRCTVPSDRVHVTVRLFAVLRDRAGASEIDLELPEGARVADALARIEELELTRGIRAVMAVNREYADDDRPLRSGDEVALIPPVSGGAGAGGAAAHARVTDQPLSLDALLAHVRDPRAGAVVTFSGVTREVGHLDYEAYAEMAQRLIGEIVTAAIARHGLCRARRRASRRPGDAERGVGGGGGVGPPSRRGIRGRPRDHR